MLARVQNGNQKSGPGFGVPQPVSLNHSTSPARVENKLAQLQSVHGNQGMQRLLAGGVLQRKLTVNQPGDVFEQEADRVADAVMRMPDPAVTPQRVRQIGSAPGVQCCSCGKSSAGECQESKAKSMQLQRTADYASASATAPPIVHDVLRSSGQPLDAASRSFMEPRFGYDFSGVRLHTDTKASESARAVNALAYTVGNNVVFASGQWSPPSQRGRRMLAHELTHVLQQSSGQLNYRSSVARSTNPVVALQGPLGSQAVQRQSPVGTNKPSRTFDNVTPAIFACVKSDSLKKHGTIYTPPDANQGTATTKGTGFKVVLGFSFNPSESKITYTLEEKTWIVPEGKIWGGIQDAIKACRK